MKLGDKVVGSVMIMGLAVSSFGGIVSQLRPSLFTPIVYIIRNYPVLFALTSVSGALFFITVLYAFNTLRYVWVNRKVVFFSNLAFIFSIMALVVTLPFVFTADIAIGHYVGMVLIIFQLAYLASILAIAKYNH